MTFGAPPGDGQSDPRPTSGSGSGGRVQPPRAKGLVNRPMSPREMPKPVSWTSNTHHGPMTSPSTRIGRVAPPPRKSAHSAGDGKPHPCPGRVRRERGRPAGPNASDPQGSGPCQRRRCSTSNDFPADRPCDEPPPPPGGWRAARWDLTTIKTAKAVTTHPNRSTTRARVLL